MQGTIGFDRLRISCVIGDLPQEREKEQLIEVSVKVQHDFSSCALSDDLSDTVDYVAISNLCRREAVEGKYRMIETYASRTLDKLMLEFPIQNAWILVRKPGAIPEADCSFVELFMEKH